MEEKKCIICNITGKSGLTLGDLRGKPFFCQRCLLIILLNNSSKNIIDKYCSGLKPVNNSLPLLAPENIWKEVK